MSEDMHCRIARKIYSNERLTDEERKELRIHFDSVIAELRVIFMRNHKWEEMVGK